MNDILSVTKNYDGESPPALLNYDVKYTDGKNSTVPISEENRHYSQVLEWVADGNTIAEPA